MVGGMSAPVLKNIAFAVAALSMMGLAQLDVESFWLVTGGYLVGIGHAVAHLKARRWAK